MLLEFGLKNFYCFKEGVTISFQLDEKCPATISQGKGFTPLLCIKGANGSGKTHILKGISFLSWFCTKSFGLKPDDAIGLEPYYDREEPSELFADFIHEGTRYCYEISTTSREIKRETIYRTKSKKSKILERVGSELTYVTRELSRLKSVKLRKNASIISTAHQYEFEELAGVYRFFNTIYTNVSYGGLDEHPIDISSISEFLHKNEKVFEFVKSIIRDCDLGISNIKIHSLTTPEDKKTYFPVFLHKVDGKEHPITEFTESSGTKALFRNLASYKPILDTGGVLVLDEFDLHLHPHILPKLLDFFLNAEKNNKNAQMIFSTHNSELLDFMGRYRTYLVNKESNESYAYRLDEIPGDIIRNDRPIAPAYAAGKIGGIPKI